MSSVVDLSGLTLNTREAESPSQAIFETVYAKPELVNAHGIQTGIIMDQQIPFFGLLGLVGEADTDCDAPTSTEQISTSEKTWTPKTIGFRLAHCQKDVDALFKIWERSMKAKDQWEQIENPMVTFLSQRVVDASLESQLRLSSFGDTAAANIASAGRITDGVNVKYFNVIDGIWKQVETGVTAETIEHVNIPENEEAAKADQVVLDDDRAYKVLKAMYEAADSRLLAQPGKVFELTRSLFVNLESYLESKTLNAGFVERTENGASGLSYRGIPIVVRDDWDRNIRAYMYDGTKYDNPHRALLTVKENIPIGTSDEDSMKNLEMFYDRTDRKHYIDVAYSMDAKVLQNYLVVAAY